MLPPLERRFPVSGRAAAVTRSLGLILLLIAAGALPATGQFVDARVPDHIRSGQEANLFLGWQGIIPVSGWIVELPSGWRLTAADMVDTGRLASSDLEILDLSGPGPRYRIQGSGRVTGPRELVLTVRSGNRDAVEDVRVRPFVVEEVNGRERPNILDSASLARRVIVSRIEQAGPNRSLYTGSDDAAPVVPSFPGARAFSAGSFTAELWLRTVTRNVVVLSTWTGDERDAYPLEFMIDARGRLSWYWGQPGWHQSLATLEPVADGAWHHIAVVHDASRSSYRLYVDGRAADSLHAMSLDLADADVPLGIGSRPAPNARGGRFVGWLDEIRIWRTARTSAEITGAMRVPLASESAGPIVFGFDEDFPSQLLRPSVGGRRVQASDLALLQPVRDLRADVEVGVVELSWTTYATEEQRFFVERSENGLDFEAAGLIEGPNGFETGRRTFRFRDFVPPDEGAVRYYRIRQVFAAGAEQVSGIVKVGLGLPDDGAVGLIGVSPNPFNAWTNVSFEVRHSEQVRVAVWDISGHQVDLLADRVFDPGIHQVRFNADGLPSGMYFVRLQTLAGVQTLTMALMK